jgi:hypothetical protein
MNAIFGISWALNSGATLVVHFQTAVQAGQWHETILGLGLMRKRIEYVVERIVLNFF